MGSRWLCRIVSLLLMLNVARSEGVETFKVIGAGMGTTATHSIYHELCAMGLGSAHWALTCNKVDTRFSKQYLKLGHEMRTHINDANRYIEIVRLKTQSIIQLCEKDGVQAILDTPTPNIFDELYKTSPNVKVILTVRDHKLWAKRRLEEHSTHETLCRESLMSKLSDYDDKSKGATFIRNDDMYKGHPLPPLPHAYSFHTCVHRASIKQHVDGRNRSLTSAIISVPQFIEYAELTFGPGKGAQLAESVIEDAFIEYNDYIRKTVPADRLLEVNLWEQDGCEFHDKIELFLNRNVSKEWRGSLIGVEVGKHLGSKISEECPPRKTP